MSLLANWARGIEVSNGGTWGFGRGYAVTLDLGTSSRPLILLLWFNKTATALSLHCGLGEGEQGHANDGQLYLRPPTSPPLHRCNGVVQRGVTLVVLNERRPSQLHQLRHAHD